MPSDIQVVANRLASATDADILLINGSIEFDFDKHVWAALSIRKYKRANVYLILVTGGGSANAAFRASRFLQDNYNNFRAVVSGWCKSAGTLVCIGAHEIVMTDMGELGPLDVQLEKPDDLGARLSGLALNSAFRSLQALSFKYFETFLLETINKSGGRITTRTAADIASAVTVGVMQPIFGQVDPVRLGEDYRSTRVAEEYAARLNLKSQNLISDQDWRASEALVRGYPSHDFVIDRVEAETLFRRVARADGDMAILITMLGDTAIYPRPMARGASPIVEYLNEEVPHATATVSAAPSAVGDKPAIKRRGGKKAGNGRLSPAPEKGA